MKTFLWKYWPWIVVPVVLLIGGLAVLLGLGADEGASPYQHNVFG